MLIANPRFCLLLALLWVGLEGSSPAAGDASEMEEYAIVTRENLARMDDADADARWSFTLTMEREGEVTVIQHDPLQKELEQRSLILVNGAPPTEEQLQVFREEEEKRLADQEEQGGRARLAELVDVATLALVWLAAGVTALVVTRAVAGMAAMGVALPLAVTANIWFSRPRWIAERRRH